MMPQLTALDQFERVQTASDLGLVFPVLGALHGFFPARIHLLFVSLLQLWLEFALDDGLAAQLIQTAPEAASQACQIGRAKS